MGVTLQSGWGGGDEVSLKTIPSFNLFVLKEMLELRVWNCCTVCSDKRRAKALAASERFDPGHQHVKTDLSRRLPKKLYPSEDLAKTLGKTTPGVFKLHQSAVVSAHYLKMMRAKQDV